LTRKCFFGKLLFPMSIRPIRPVETLTEFEFPQREAAFFYGLFLRDIPRPNCGRTFEVPPVVLAKWHAKQSGTRAARHIVARGAYRRHVLAIFDTLIGSEKMLQRPHSS